MKAKDIDSIVASFDSLPDDALIPKRAVAKILNASTWTLDRIAFPFVRISERLVCGRAGDVRAAARGKPAPV